MKLEARVIKNLSNDIEYEAEKVVKKFNDANGTHIQILRTPIGASELNPIELIWARIKEEIVKGFV